MSKGFLFCFWVTLCLHSASYCGGVCNPPPSPHLAHDIHIQSDRLLENAQHSCLTAGTLVNFAATMSFRSKQSGKELLFSTPLFTWSNIYLAKSILHNIFFLCVCEMEITQKSCHVGRSSSDFSTSCLCRAGSGRQQAKQGVPDATLNSGVNIS